MNLKHNLLATAIIASVSASAYAQSQQQPTRQPEVIVTAVRFPQTSADTLADVSVITRADIDRSGASDLLQLLRLQAGVEVARVGGPGQQTSVFLRGTNSNQILVLVDGVRVASANSGAFAWEELPLDAIARIEIVRGPRAAQWGSDAIGGVIQIFTRKLAGPHLATRIGSHGDYAGSAGIGDWSKDGGYSVIVGARHVRGVAATDPLNYAYSPQADGFSNQNLAARAAYRVGSQWLSGSVLRSDSNVDFNQGSSRVIEQAAGVDLAGPVHGDWSQRLSLGNDREDLLTPAYQSLYLSRRQSIGWQNVIGLGDGQRLALGIDWLHERGVNRDTGANSDVYAGSRDNTGLYAGWYGTRGAFDWSLAGRRDHNSVFGNADTASLAAGWRFSDRARLTASWGQGFRAPSLSEEFSPGYFGYYAGNPALRPERSTSSEAGLELTPAAGLRVKLDAYHTRISDLIDFSGGATYQAVNIARATIDGFESTLDWRAAVWGVHANATWLDARDADSGQRLLRRPAHVGSVVLTRYFSERVNAGLELYGSGRSPDYGGTLGGYGLVNARLNWTVSDALALHLRLDNLADHRYSLAYGYTTPGRSAWLTLSWSPR